MTNGPAKSPARTKIWYTMSSDSWTVDGTSYLSDNDAKDAAAKTWRVPGGPFTVVYDCVNSRSWHEHPVDTIVIENGATKFLCKGETKEEYKPSHFDTFVVIVQHTPEE